MTKLLLLTTIGLGAYVAYTNNWFKIRDKVTSKKERIKTKVEETIDLSQTTPEPSAQPAASIEEVLNLNT